MFWPFLSPEAWAEYMRSNGVDPDSIPDAPPVKCEICEIEIEADLVHVQLDTPPGFTSMCNFHIDCFVNHLCANIDNPKDVISNCVLRKIV